MSLKKSDLFSFQKTEKKTKGIEENSPLVIRLSGEWRKSNFLYLLIRYAIDNGYTEAYSRLSFSDQLQFFCRVDGDIQFDKWELTVDLTTEGKAIPSPTSETFEAYEEKEELIADIQKVYSAETDSPLTLHLLTTEQIRLLKNVVPGFRCFNTETSQIQILLDNGTWIRSSRYEPFVGLS